MGCLTYSVGFRAPSRSELLESFAAHAARRLAEDDRYTDAGIGPCATAEAGAIDAAAVERLRSLVRVALDAALEDDAFVEQWAGCALTAPKRPAAAASTVLHGGRWHAADGEWPADLLGNQMDERDDGELDGIGGGGIDSAANALDGLDHLSPPYIVQAILGASAEIGCLRRAEGSVFAFVQAETSGGANRLFVDGEEVPVGSDAAQHLQVLCAGGLISAAELRGPLRDSVELQRLVERLLREDFLWVDLEI